jgi:hypothetical protein
MGVVIFVGMEVLASVEIKIYIHHIQHSPRNIDEARPSARKFAQFPQRHLQQIFVDHLRKF